MDSSHHLVGDQQHAVQGERTPNDEVADQLRLQGDVQDPIAALGSLSVIKKRTGKYILFPKKKFETQNASTKKSREMRYLHGTLILSKKKPGNIHRQHVTEGAVLLQSDAARHLKKNKLLFVPFKYNK